jgi:uncharacterized cupredoxin-like copper-binding protein
MTRNLRGLRAITSVATALLLIAGLFTFVAACGDDDDDTSAASADPTAEADPEADPEAEADPDPEADPEAEKTADLGEPDESVKVTLDEWKVEPAKSSVGPGVIRFFADNSGEDVHELVVLKDGEELGEVESVGPNQIKSFKVKLEPGKYELACLLQEKEANGEIEDHYELGMHTAFEVK